MLFEHPARMRSRDMGKSWLQQKLVVCRFDTAEGLLDDNFETSSVDDGFGCFANGFAVVERRKTTKMRLQVTQS